MKSILGIDPGLSGALALLGPEFRVYDMPTLEHRVAKTKKRTLDAHALASLLEVLRGQVEFAIIERVGAMPGQGVTSCFSFGWTAGSIYQACCSAGIQVQRVVPVVWKRKFGLIGQGKDASRAEASRRLPQHAHHWVRAKDDGRAEAALLAIYGSLLDTPANFGGTQ